MTDLDKMARELLAAEYDAEIPESMTVGLLRDGSSVRWSDRMALRAIRAALLTAPPGYVQVPVEALRRWQAAFAEELAAHDISPPIKHVKDGHDETAAMLAAAPEPKCADSK